MALKPILFVWCLMSAFAARTQDVQINEPPVVDAIMTRWVELNRAKPALSGWRIQLISSTDRRNVEEGKNRFLEYFPELRADWIHEKPYYKLRAGAFLTKAEAYEMLDRVKDVFSGAYPIADHKIHPRELLE